MSQPDLTDLSIYKVEVTLDNTLPHAEEDIANECANQAAEMGVAIGADKDWILTSSDKSPIETYELQVVALSPQELLTVLEKGVDRGIQLAGKALREFAGQIESGESDVAFGFLGVDSTDACAVLRWAASVLDENAE